MKTRCFIIKMVVLLAMASCTPNDHCRDALNASPKDTASPTLSAIDSLMWQQPDSALMRLLPYFDTCIATEYNRHYAHLLLAELLYKNDSAQTNRAELQQAVAYFDSLVRQVSPPFKGAGGIKNKNSTFSTHAFLDARAHYINGVGYYENDSAVPACSEYLKALEVMEGHFTEKELVGKKAKFMALTYTHLTALFSDLYLHEQAIYFGKMALEYYQKYDATSWHLAWILDEIGSQYDMMNDFDMADIYYKEGLKVLPNTNNLIYRDISTLQAFVSYKKDKDLNAALRQLHNLVDLSESENECLSRHAIIGEIFYRENQFDSAWIHLDKVFRETQNIALKKQAAEWLVDLCKTFGRDPDILEYANYLVPFANLEENKSEIKSQLTELYKDYEKQKAEIKYQKQKKQNQRATNRAFGILFLVIGAIVMLYLANKRRHKRLLSQYKETEQQLETEQQVHRMEQAVLSGRLKRSNEKVRELKNQIQRQKNSSIPKPETQAATFADEPICRLIMNRVNEGRFLSQVDCTIYKDYALGMEQLMALREAADRHYNYFTIRIAKAYPELTKSDLDYCCLYLLGLTDADIAALMQRAYNTINERNKKLKKVLGTEKAVSSTLLSFAHESIAV